MRRIAIVTAVLVMATATWYAAFRAAALAHYVDTELDRAKSLTQLAPRPQATIVYDRDGQARVHVLRRAADRRAARSACRRS